MERNDIEGVAKYIKATEENDYPEPYIDTAGIRVTHLYMWVKHVPYNQSLPLGAWEYYTALNQVYEDCLESKSWQKLLREAKVKREQLGSDSAIDIFSGVYFVLTESPSKKLQMPRLRNCSPPLTLKKSKEKLNQLLKMNHSGPS